MPLSDFKHYTATVFSIIHCISFNATKCNTTSNKLVKSRSKKYNKQHKKLNYFFYHILVVFVVHVERNAIFILCFFKHATCMIYVFSFVFGGKDFCGCFFFVHKYLTFIKTKFRVGYQKCLNYY